MPSESSSVSDDHPEFREELLTSAPNPAAPFLYMAAIEQVGQLDQIVSILWRTLSMKTTGRILWTLMLTCSSWSANNSVAEKPAN